VLQIFLSRLYNNPGSAAGWRLLQDGEGLWKEVLIEKYGPWVCSLLGEGVATWPRYISKWWTDIVNVEESGGERWFNAEVIRKDGNGNSTRFWKDPWWGESSVL